MQASQPLSFNAGAFGRPAAGLGGLGGAGAGLGAGAPAAAPFGGVGLGAQAQGRGAFGAPRAGLENTSMLVAAQLIRSVSEAEAARALAAPAAPAAPGAGSRAFGTGRASTAAPPAASQTPQRPTRARLLAESAASPLHTRSPMNAHRGVITRSFLGREASSGLYGGLYGSGLGAPAPEPAPPGEGPRLEASGDLDAAGLEPGPPAPRAEPEPPAEPAAGRGAPRLAAPGYVTFPPMEELVRLPEAVLAEFCGFSIERPGYGRIDWLGPVDLRGVDLGEVVQLDEGMMRVYDRAAPPRGEKLNRPARVTLYGVHRRDPATGRPLEDPGVREAAEEAIRRATAAQGAELVSYDYPSGVWVFRVDHFA